LLTKSIINYLTDDNESQLNSRQTFLKQKTWLALFVSCLFSRIYFELLWKIASPEKYIFSFFGGLGLFIFFSLLPLYSAVLCLLYNKWE